jgi:murein DD-endopeptidase MepM/ murein hydrolase activator NlpD
MQQIHAPNGETHAGRPRRRARAAWVAGATAIAIVLLAAGTSFLLWSRPTPTPVITTTIAPPAPPPPVTGSFGKGRTLQDVLMTHGVPKDRALQIVQAVRPHIDFRRLQPQDRMELHRDTSGDLVKFVYRQSPLDIVEVTRAGDTWTASRLDVPTDRRLVVVAGTLRENLFESMERLDERPQLVLDFAEIFAWDFDFAADSQPGDRFRMLVEKVFTGEQFVKYGRILAAEYESEGRLHTGVHFRDKEGGDYYTPAGESLRRAFLKSPLEFTRISSSFSRARRHPILGGMRPHLAVDYAAPHGTPVFAVADGTVESAAWSGGGGKTIVLRHRANFKTMYNHLSRFAKGIRSGAAVRQRQVIGYVGSTGLSTGPHLDYRVIKDGRFVNPLKQTFLPGLPISPSSRGTFTEARDSLLSQLRGTEAARTAR